MVCYVEFRKNECIFVSLFDVILNIILYIIMERFNGDENYRVVDDQYIDLFSKCSK